MIHKDAGSLVLKDYENKNIMKYIGLDFKISQLNKFIWNKAYCPPLHLQYPEKSPQKIRGPS